MLKRKSVLRNEKGLATIEMIPIMIVIAILLNFALGFFGVIHTGILNSIASRNYAFETFRHRANLVYFHDIRGAGDFAMYNSRVHGIASERRQGTDNAVVTTRPIGFGMNPADEGSQDDHEPQGVEETRGIFSVADGQRNTDVGASPVWVRPMYGICLNAKCSR